VQFRPALSEVVGMFYRFLASLGGMGAGFILGIAAVAQPTGWDLVIVIACAFAAWAAGMFTAREDQ
jgi:hypothetical protein